MYRPYVFFGLLRSLQIDQQTLFASSIDQCRHSHPQGCCLTRPFSCMPQNLSSREMVGKHQRRCEANTWHPAETCDPTEDGTQGVTHPYGSHDSLLRRLSDWDWVRLSLRLLAFLPLPLSICLASTLQARP